MELLNFYGLDSCRILVQFLGAFREIEKSDYYLRHVCCFSFVRLFTGI